MFATLLRRSTATRSRPRGYARGCGLPGVPGTRPAAPLTRRVIPPGESSPAPRATLAPCRAMPTPSARRWRRRPAARRGRARSPSHQTRPCVARSTLHPVCRATSGRTQPLSTHTLRSPSNTTTLAVSCSRMRAATAQGKRRMDPRARHGQARRSCNTIAQMSAGAPTRPARIIRLVPAYIAASAGPSSTSPSTLRCGVTSHVLQRWPRPTRWTPTARPPRGQRRCCRPLPNSFFISLGFVCSLLLPLQSSHLAIHSRLLIHLLVAQVCLSLHGLLHLGLTHAILLLLIGVDVSLSLCDDLSSTLAGFIDFLHDLALFHLEKTDTVAEQF